MPEAEVALRLVDYVLRRIVNANQAKVSIDGAAAKRFPMAGFLGSTGWEQVRQRGKNAWAGFYGRNSKTLEVHSRPGEGDVLIPIGELRLIAECKKGPREKSRNGQERRLLAETIGQAVKWSGGPSDIVFIAVPQTDEFERVADDWLRSPRFQSTGVRIALVGGDDSVVVVQTGNRQELDVLLLSIRDER
jgi:hypothetical protein